MRSSYGVYVGALVLCSAWALSCRVGSDEVNTDEGVGGFLTGVVASGPQTGAPSGSPSSSSTGGTTSQGGGGSGGTGQASSTAGAGGNAAGGAGGSGGAPVCNDQGVGEPNDSEGTAHKLSDKKISDCDGAKTFTGTLSGNEEEWLFYEGDDNFGFSCSVDPTRTLSPTDKGLRLCKFFECLSGKTEFTCPGGTTKATSGNGRAGCCGSQGFTVSDLNCTGTIDDVAYVYMRIDHPQPSANHCIDWTLTYKY